MKHIILVIVITLIFIGIIWRSQAQIGKEYPLVSVTNTYNKSIEAEAETIDIGDLDAGFKDIDASISTL